MIPAQPISVTAVAPVFEVPAYFPDDPLFTSGSQWYLYDSSKPVASLNISSIWDDYTGAGIAIGIIDDGVEYFHEDLAANANPSMGRNFVSHKRTVPNDGRPFDTNDRHGTTVAGVIAGVDNDKGIIGIAYDAKIAGLRVGFNADHATAQVHSAFIAAKDFDIVNNSWGYSGYFYDNYNDLNSFGNSGNPFALINDALIDAVANGRPHETDAGVNLGTIFVMASGNDRLTIGTKLPDQDVNYHGLTSSPHVITVGGYIHTGQDADFSTPGAAVLLAGPAHNMKTTDLTGSNGFNTGGDYITKSGTSYAAPAVAGVTALMLEANPNLGYRDVQEIFTLSSQFGDPNDTDWIINGADDWNGGGRHVSRELGFGTLDAYNAVRLAETWDAVSTYDNLIEATVNSGTINAVLDRNTVSKTITVSDQGIDLEHVVLTVNMSHFRVGELTVTLTSPDGTTSLLINKAGGGAGYASSFIDEFALTSVQFWGEQIAGNWTVRVTDNDYVTTDTLQHTGFWRDFNLTFLGNAESDDDLYVYTSEYAEFGTNSARQTLADAAGTDTLNLATIADGMAIDLTPGAANTLRGNPFRIGAGTVIENVYGGDGADSFIGNMTANHLRGMRGDDGLTGGGGNDLLDGGAGYDTAFYAGFLGDFAITLNLDETVTIEDLTGLEGIDILVDVEVAQFADAAYIIGDSTAPPLLPGKPPVVLPAITHSGTAANSEYIQGDDGDNVLTTGGGVWDLLDGGKGNDSYIIYNSSVSIRDSSFQGTDTIYSGAYSYTLPAFIEIGIMLDNAAILNGSPLDNYLEGNDFDNFLDGKDGNDQIAAWGGDDQITGGKLNDEIDGGAGRDTAVFDGNRADFLVREHADGTISVLDLIGDLGMDRLARVEFLAFNDQTVAVPNAIADPAGVLAFTPLPHPSGYVVPAPTHAGSTENYENVWGTTADEVLWGGGGHSDLLVGYAGDDTYIITHPNTDIREYSGNGSDTIAIYVSAFATTASIENIYMMDGAISFTGGAGDSTVYGNDHVNIVNADDGDDHIFGYGGNDKLYGGAGDDVLYGGAGNDVLDGGAGGDAAVYAGAIAGYSVVENADKSITVTDNVGAEGIDTLLNIETVVFADDVYYAGGAVPPPPPPTVALPAETHSGTGAGGEHIIGTSGDDVLNGRGGNWDRLEGRGGNDAYIVETEDNLILDETSRGGTDTIYTDIAATVMPLHFEIAYMLGNADSISGTNFSNHIEGNGKSNQIYGLDDTDTLMGGGGDDLLAGGGDNDFIDGGNGTDTAAFSSALADYLIEVQGDGSFTVVDLVGNDGTDRLINVELLQFADQTVAAPLAGAGGSGTGALSALPGADNVLPPDVTVSGTLESYENTSGGTGADVLSAGGGYLDTLIGGDGNDSYIIESESTRVRENYNGGNDTVYSYASSLSLSTNIETFYMMYGALELTASGHDNTIFGNKHDNTIDGKNGNDTIAGFEGDDLLIGGGGSDTAVFQGDLADFDILFIGGTQLLVSDTAGGGQGNDSIIDFEHLRFDDQTVDVMDYYA